MQLVTEKQTSFVDRRSAQDGPPGVERRQFSDQRTEQRPEVRELAEAVDQYKLLHRRRFVTFDELYNVIVSLGYHK
jgi:hypothetical protein